MQATNFLFSHSICKADFDQAWIYKRALHQEMNNKDNRHASLMS
jgi:hypothetical protein